MFKVLDWLSDGSIKDWDDIIAWAIIIGPVLLLIGILILGMHSQGTPTDSYDPICNYPHSC